MAGQISDDLKNKVYDIIVDELEIFASSFIEAMAEYKNKVIREDN